METSQEKTTVKIRSPVPLKKEEEENEEIRALAEKLAPAFEEADALIQVPEEFRSEKGGAASTDEDSIDDEVEALEFSQALLRQELELANDFSNLFRSFDAEEGEELPQETEEESPSPGGATEADFDGTEAETPEQLAIRPPQQVVTKSPRTPESLANEILVTTPRYTQSDHFSYLNLSMEEKGGWYSVDLTRHYTKDSIPVVKEYCLTVPDSKLKHLCVGLQSVDELPVRTIMIRIRPDILCGATMDAIFHALGDCKIHKRQGGHLQAHVKGMTVTKNDGEELYPPFFLDVQLCTFKSDACERVLIFRIYYSEDVDEYESVEDDSENVSSHLRQASALIQRMESPRKAKRIRPCPNPQEVVTDHLMQHYRACPSVKEGSVTLPALNADDFAAIRSSSRWIQRIWDELETRDLTYNTLRTSRFGSFPALPSLDVQYCSQIRRLSRDEMIVQLLKSASELEDYAREAEYECANMIALLQPTFETYGVEAPSLPRPKPLTAYPLDFVPPQQSCPPWGLKVMEALNEIQAWACDEVSAANMLTPKPLDAAQAQESLRLADKAVQLVVRAFQQQDDEEKGARLSRKNMQVMDRLAKMTEHEKLSISSLHLSYGLSDKAALAADDFFAKSGIREVPLLKWSIVVGGSTGTCLVTANHILFVTQLIPVIGGSRTSLWKIREVEFHVQEGTVSLLNPLPTVISVERHGKEVYSFRPSMGGARLKSFLDIVQATVVDDSILRLSTSERTAND